MNGKELVNYIRYNRRVMSYVLSKTLLLYPVLVSLGLAIFAIVMLLLPARTPYVYQLLKQSSSRLQAISEDYRDSHFPCTLP